MRLAASRKAPKEHVIKIIEALYGETSRPDIPLEAAEAEVARIATVAGRPPSAGLRQDRRSAIMHLQRWADRFRPNLPGARAIGRAEAQSFAMWMTKEGRSDKTRWNLIGILSTMWNVLRREHEGLENPWPLARPMHVSSSRRGAFTPEEARRLFAAGDADGHGWGLAARISAATGLRYGDVARLKYGDIVGGCIQTDPHKTKAHGISVSIPLPPDLLALIGEGDPDAWILPEHGEGYAHEWVNKHPFRDIMIKAGVEANGRTFHSFRHYFRTQLSRAGVSDEIAMKLGGWTQRTTADRYDHDGRSKEKAAAVAAAWALTESLAD
jgi:integrase